MKKLLIMLLLLVITIPSYAQKREWFDSGYDFTKVKSIAFALKKDDRYSDLVLNEMKDIPTNSTTKTMKSIIHFHARIPVWMKWTTSHFISSNFNSI